MNRRAVLLSLGGVLMAAAALWWGADYSERQHRLEIAQRLDAGIVSPQIAELTREMQGGAPQYVDPNPRANAILAEPTPAVPCMVLAFAGFVAVIAGIATPASLKTPDPTPN